LELLWLITALLLKANHQSNSFFLWTQKITVLPWQFVSSQVKLSVEFWIQRNKMIRLLKILEDEKIVNIKWYSKYSLFTIVNWVKYQKRWTSNDTANDTTNEQQVNTNNNDNNDNNENTKRSKEQKEKIWKTYPHSRKGKKQDAINYIIKQDYEVVLHTVNIYKWEVYVGMQDATYVPWCHLRCRDFVPYSEMIAKNKLKEIYNRLLEWRKTEEIKQFTDDFWQEYVLGLYEERAKEQQKLLLSWLQ
jgi:hypothetical protein